mmetsp:Transcript_18105/g.42295  ORF Transcript_18105/g.42295 Transcript_18105/m.42295 type:complete len:351 (+) Transcript_18105:533-1585(+)
MQQNLHSILCLRQCHLTSLVVHIPNEPCLTSHQVSFKQGPARVPTSLLALLKMCTLDRLTNENLLLCRGFNVAPVLCCESHRPAAQDDVMNAILVWPTKEDVPRHDVSGEPMMCRSWRWRRSTNLWSEGIISGYHAHTTWSLEVARNMQVHLLVATSHAQRVVALLAEVACIFLIDSITTPIARSSVVPEHHPIPQFADNFPLHNVTTWALHCGLLCWPLGHCFGRSRCRLHAPYVRLRSHDSWWNIPSRGGRQARLPLLLHALRGRGRLWSGCRSRRRSLLFGLLSRVRRRGRTWIGVRASWRHGRWRGPHWTMLWRRPLVSPLRLSWLTMCGRSGVGSCLYVFGGAGI